MINALQNGASAQDIGAHHTTISEFDRQNEFAAICESALREAERRARENDLLREKLNALQARLDDALNRPEPELAPPPAPQMPEIDYERLARLVAQRVDAMTLPSEQAKEQKANQQFVHLAERLECLQAKVVEIAEAKPAAIDIPEMPDLSGLGHVVSSLEKVAKGIAAVTGQMSQLTEVTRKQSENINQLKTELKDQFSRLPEKDAIDRQFADQLALTSKLRTLAEQSIDPDLHDRQKRTSEMEKAIEDIGTRLDMMMRHQSGIAADVQGLISNPPMLPLAPETPVEDKDDVFKQVESWRDEITSLTSKLEKATATIKGPMARNITVSRRVGT